MLQVTVYIDGNKISVKADKVKVNENGDLLLQDLNDPTPHTGFASGFWEFYKTETVVEGEGDGTPLTDDEAKEEEKNDDVRGD